MQARRFFTTGGLAGQRYERMIASLEPWQHTLLTHPVYYTVQSPSDIRTFMGVHVFAVWDFMNLVMALKTRLAPVNRIWVEPANKQSARFINEIVMCEESDEMPPDYDEPYDSHLGLYREAMWEAGAKSPSFDSFYHTARITGKAKLSQIKPVFVRRFVKTTLEYCKPERKAHEVAAAFLLGREDPIPKMFQSLLESSTNANARGYISFRHYLKRHISVDSTSHAPMGREILEDPCGDDPNKWMEAENAAKTAISTRIALWDGTLKLLLMQRRQQREQHQRQQNKD